MRNGDGAIPLAECRNIIFMGTLACGGHAKAVVIATGQSSTSSTILPGIIPGTVMWCKICWGSIRGRPAARSIEAAIINST